MNHYRSVILSLFLCNMIAQANSTNLTWIMPEMTVSSTKNGPASIQSNYNSVAVYDTAILNTLPDLNNLNHLIDYVPNVERTSQEGFSIRGVSSGEADSFFGLYDKAPVITLFKDGTTIQNHQLNTGIFELWDVESVEWLRGPASMTEGGATLAGAVYIKTHDPSFSEQDSGRAKASAASFNTMEAAGAQNVVLDNNWAARAAVDYLRSDGFNEAADGDAEVDFHDSLSGRLKLLYQPQHNTDFSALFSIEAAKQRLNPQSALVDAQHPARRITPDYVERNDSDASSWIGSVNLHFLPVSAWNIRFLNHVSQYDLDGPNLFNGSTGDSDIHERAVSSELRANRDYTRLHLLGGLFASRKSHSSTYDFQNMTDPITRITLDMKYDADYTRDGAAAYGQCTYDLLPPLTLQAGLRLDAESVDQSASQVYFSQMVPYLSRLSGDGSYDDTFTAALPSASVTYRFDEFRSASFSIQRAFRSGGLSIPIGSVYATPNTYDPEYSWNYELAWRSSWLDRSLTLNMNVFYTDWQDRQVRVSTGYYDLRNVPVYCTKNAAEATLYGSEINWNYTPSFLPACTLFNGWGYTDAQTGNDELWSSGSFVDGHEWNTSAGLIVTLPLNLQAVCDFSYHDRSNRHDGLDNYALVNAALNGRWNRFSISLYVRNIGDETYLYDNQTTLVALGPPRTIGISAEVNW